MNSSALPLKSLETRKEKKKKGKMIGLNTIFDSDNILKAR